jgi:hypothetical protein
MLVIKDEVPSDHLTREQIIGEVMHIDMVLME